MTIAAASPSQKNSAYATSTSVSCAFPNNVASGSLLVVFVGSFATSSPHTIASTDVTKSAGTATIGTVSLDASVTWNNAGIYPMAASVFSCLVTGGGSLTLQFANAPANSGLWIAIDEYTGSWDGTRAEDTSTVTHQVAATALSSGDVTTAGAGLIFGGVLHFTASGIRSLTEDAAFTLVGELDSTASTPGGSAIARIVSTGTTDSATWDANLSTYGSVAAVAYKESAGSPPTAPTAGTASNIAPESATANWTDNSSDETGFKVETAPDPYSSWTSQGTASANATSRSLTGLSQTTSYKFRVAATNANGDSSWSTSAAFTTATWSYVRPASDISEGWSLSAGTDSWDLLNETTYSDTDYIYATAAAQTTEVKLAAMSTPAAGTSLLVNYRIQGIAGGAQVTVYLYCGATLIKTDTTRSANGDYTMTVAYADWDTEVTDWSDMRLRFVSS